MANFVARHPSKGTAWVNVRGGHFTVDFARDTDLPRRHPTSEFKLVMDQLREQGCTVSCKSWITPRIVVAPVVTDGVKHYEASATLDFDGMKTVQHFAHGMTPKDAYSAFWELWNQRCDELRVPRDVVVIQRRTTVRL